MTKYDKLPDPIPDTPENVARAIMQRPPKKNWRYLDGDEDETSEEEVVQH